MIDRSRKGNARREDEGLERLKQDWIRRGHSKRVNESLEAFKPTGCRVISKK